MVNDRIRVLISAPSLSVNKNVSGISAVVNSIIGSKNDIVYYHLEVGRTDKDKWGLLSYLNTIFRLFLFPVYILKNRIDVFHQNLPFNNKGLLREVLFNFLARICFVPVVLHIHGGEFLTKKPESKLKLLLINSIFKGSKERIVLSDVEANLIKSLYGFDAISLPNSIDTEVFFQEGPKLFNEVPKIIFLGRFHESKGLIYLTSAFKNLYKKHRFQFVLCGKGELERFLVEELKNIIGDDFDFRGVISGEEKIKALTNSDFFVLPSTYGEGLPISLLEAMSCGVIPVVTDDASMKVVVENMYNGIRVEKMSSSDIEEKLAFLFQLPNEEKFRLSNNARKTVKENYSNKKYLSKLLSIYKHSIK